MTFVFFFPFFFPTFSFFFEGLLPLALLLLRERDLLLLLFFLVELPFSAGLRFDGLFDRFVLAILNLRGTEMLSSLKLTSLKKIEKLKINGKLYPSGAVLYSYSPSGISYSTGKYFRTVKERYYSYPTSTALCLYCTVTGHSYEYTTGTGVPSQVFPVCTRTSVLVYWYFVSLGTVRV